MKKAIFMGEDFKNRRCIVFNDELKSKLYEKLDFLPDIVHSTELEARKDELFDVSYIFSSWGMCALTSEEIATYLPNLKAVFYAAGTVQFFAKPFLDNGVEVFSSWAANAVPVAEYSAAQIILANKGFFTASQMTKSASFDKAKDFAIKFHGNYDAQIGILGAGMIGKMVIENLSPFKLHIKVFDPFLDPKVAEQMGVTLASLEEIFSTCNVVSNHLANNEHTVKILSKDILDRMNDYTTFINTGRGAQVDEDALVSILEKNPTITAVLDVTWPEPAEKGHKFYELNNVILTPHIAGSLSNELARLGQYMYDEFLAFDSLKPTKYSVTKEMLETMA